MLDAFLNSVLPVFAIVGIGMAFGRAGLFDSAQAAAINRFAFFLGVPVLLFWLLARSDATTYDWSLLGIYLSIEIAFYAGGVVLFRLVMRRPLGESLLLAMSIVFVNHLMYVLPIAQAAFGPSVAPPIASMIVIDVVVFYGGTVVLLELLSGQATAASPMRTAMKVLGNPQTLGIGLGIVVSLLHLPLDNGFGVFSAFVAGAAPPVSLFALGVVLVAQKYEGRALVPALIAGLNLFAVPVAGYFVLVQGLEFESARTMPALLVMAGPVGAMPFVLALQYGYPTGEIGRAILLSTLLSLVSMTLVMQVM